MSKVKNIIVKEIILKKCNLLELKEIVVNKVNHPFINNLFDQTIEELVSKNIIKIENDIVIIKNQENEFLFNDIKEINTKNILYEIFKIIYNSTKEISYDKIITKLKIKIKNKELIKKLSNYLLSHYCRKLYKLGLIEFSNQKKNSVKLVYSKSNYNLENIISIDNLNKENSYENSEEISLEKRDNNKLTEFYFEELTFDENLFLNINSFELHENFKLNDIYNKMNCYNRKKLINKYFENPNNLNLNCTPVRDGKNYFNQYNLKKNKITQAYKNINIKLENNYFIDNKLKNIIIEILNKFEFENIKKSIENEYNQLINNNYTEITIKRVLFLIFFNKEKIIKNNVIKKKINTQNRIDRILFILNYVYKEDKLITSLEIYNKIISEFEKDKKFTMDKKTLANIFLDLEELNFIKIKKYIIKVDNFEHLDESFEIKKWIIYLPNSNFTNEDFEKLDYITNPFKNNNSYDSKDNENIINENKIGLANNLDLLKKIIINKNKKIKKYYFQKYKIKIILEKLKLKKFKKNKFNNKFENFLNDFDLNINIFDNKELNYEKLSFKIERLLKEKSNLTIKQLFKMIDDFIYKFKNNNIIRSNNLIKEKIKEDINVNKFLDVLEEMNLVRRFELNKKEVCKLSL